MNIDDLAGPKTGDAIDMKTIGDRYDGLIDGIGEWREVTGKFGPQTKLPLTLNIDGASRTRWLKKGSREVTVIADAVRTAGATALDRGGRLQVVRVEDVPTTKGNPMHDFVAKYTAPAASSGRNVDDLFD